MKKLSALLFIAFLHFSASAQFNYGIATSNWCSMNSIVLNPAFLAGSNEISAISVGAFTTGVDNNVGAFNAANGLVVAIGDGKTNNMFSYSNNSRVSMLAPYVNVTGPGVMYRINRRSSFALTTAIRGMNQFNNFDQTIFHTFNDPSFRTTEAIDATPRNFNYTLHVWGQIGATYATTLINSPQHKLKGGITLRYLGGIAYVGVKGRAMDAHFTAGKDTFYASNVDLEYVSNILLVGKGGPQYISDNLFSGNGGTSVGADIGLAYEFTQRNERKQGYRIRVSAALMDWGSITYHGDNNANEIFSGSGYVTGKGILDNVKNFVDIQKYARDRGFTADIRKMSSTVSLPTRLMLAGDYHVDKQYYVNVTYLYNLGIRGGLGNVFYNQFTITPRYDTKPITIGLPLTYSTLSNSFKLGLGFRAGPLFFGSDDMLGLVSKTQYGLNFYIGLNAPVYKDTKKSKHNEG